MMERETLKDKTIAGMIWSFLDNIGTQVIQLIIQLVLARLLLPKDFGILGMVTIFIALSQVFVDSGFTTGLIREKNTTQEDYSTVFFFNLIMSVSLYVLFFLSAEWISAFFREAQLVNIIRVLSLVLIINAFGLIQKTMLTKKLDFKMQTNINLVSSILSGIIAISFALLGFGIWSLVVRKLAMQFIQALLLSFSNRWIPSFVFSVSSFTRLFHFGWKLLLSDVLSSLYENLYYLIIGRGFSAATLGYYTNALKLSDTAAISITTSIQNVSYPVLSNIRDNKERLKRGYKKTIKNSAYITFPVMLGLAASAPLLLKLLLGENWIPAIPYFQILCLGRMLYPMHAINLNILKVTGRSDYYLLVDILKKVTGLTLIGTVLYLDLGIIGLMWCTVLDSIIAYTINAAFSKKLLSYSISEQIKDVRAYAGMSFSMAVIVMLVGWLIPGSNLVLLLSQIVLGICFYIGLSLLFRVEEFKTVFEIVKGISFKVRKKTSVERGIKARS